MKLLLMIRIVDQNDRNKRYHGIYPVPYSYYIKKN